MRFKEIPPRRGQILSLGVRINRRTAEAAGVAIKRKTFKARDDQRQAMKTAGLGELPKAVKAESGRSTDRQGKPNSYGVIYAEGGDESRAGQALIAYSRGATIKPVKTGWLWYQTDKIKRMAKIPGIGRRRLTPERYNQIGAPLGPLKFAALGKNRAKLYVENVALNVRTGMAVTRGKRKSRTKVPVQRVTLFIGIRRTVRSQRFDPRRITRAASDLVPDDIAQQLAGWSPEGNMR